MHLGCTWQTHDLVVLCAHLHHVHIIRFHTILVWGFSCGFPQQPPIYCKWIISLNWLMFVLNMESMEFFWQPGISCNLSWSLNWAMFVLNRERMWTHHRVPLNYNLLPLSLSQVVFPFLSIQKSRLSFFWSFVNVVIDCQMGNGRLWHFSCILWIYGRVFSIHFWIVVLNTNVSCSEMNERVSIHFLVNNMQHQCFVH